MSVTVLVGTTKGLFLLDSEDRESWVLRGPFCDLWPINHAVGEAGTGHLWAAGGGPWHGAAVWRSEDGGESWQMAKLARGQVDSFAEANPEIAGQLGVTPCKAAPFDGEIDALWSLARAGGRVYAGAKPAALYASDDDGATWEKLRGLTDHPSAAGWTPGGAGLTLHSIVSDDDPARLWVGISAAGVFASEDGGASWDRRNRRDNAGGPPELNHPAAGSETEIGHCVHNIARGADGRLYQQNHHGVFRSQDGGRSWQEVTAGLPSTFGFPVAAHPSDPAMLWVWPLNGDSSGRFPPDAAAAVWRSRDGGDSWEPQRAGLPQAGCFFTVLRQAMATDPGTPAGVYFGTNSGSVFASRDEGETWTEIARHLPSVLSVETAAG